MNFTISGTVHVAVEPDTPALSQAGAVVKSTIAGVTVTSIIRGDDRMAYTLPPHTGITVQISYVDDEGRPATVDGDVQWSTSDPEIAEIVAVPSPQNTQLIVKHGGKVGNAQVKAEADADLGQGVRPLVTLWDVTMIAGEAVAGTITPVGDPMPMESLTG